MRLRTKFLLSLIAVSAGLTWATLLIVRHRVRLHVRDEIFEALRDSVITFQRFQHERELVFARSAALMADLPPIESLMTSQDETTIQDASVNFWRKAGSDLFVLADRTGHVMALNTVTAGFSREDAQSALDRSLGRGETRDWWFGGGHLYEVFLQPIYFGPPGEGTQMGVLAVGYEIGDRLAADVSRIASSQVAFRYGKALVVGTLSATQREEMAGQKEPSAILAAAGPEDVQIGNERFLATSVKLAPDSDPAATLTVLKSYDKATAFLQSLNHWILGVGLAAVLAGSILVFLISTTFTRPLASLVAGVHALEKGDFAYPLKTQGADEVAELSTAFHRMRGTIERTQQDLLHAERLATIGRMASTISHDLRHPLTVVLAYAEFLSERKLTDEQRSDFYQEIRLAVNRMTEQISSLLNFSKRGETLRPEAGSLDEVIQHSIQTIHARPEFREVSIRFVSEGSTEAWFDPRKIERVFHNLLLNACEASPADSARIEVKTRESAEGLEVRVADNGSGIPDAIRSRLFQPFISHGKENGFGLGLTVVQKIVRDHGGEIEVESTGATGTVFRFTIPRRPQPELVKS